jgi:hypothetical protein
VILYLLTLRNLGNSAFDSSQINFATGPAIAGDTRSAIAGYVRAGGKGNLIFKTWNGTTLAEQVRIDENGRLGIGSDTPAAKLDVQGTGGVILNSGNVGIGTTAPGAKFDIGGSGESIRLSGGAAQTFMTFLNGSTRKGYVGTGAGGTDMIFNVDSGAIVLQGGNVGIGTTAPGAKLEVAGTAGTDGIKFPDATLQTSAAVLTRWTNTGASTVGATTTAPTKGTNSTDQVSWRRVGDTMEMRWRYVQSATGSAGSGFYLLTIPGGYAIDTTKLPVPNSAIDYRAGVGTIKFSYSSGAGVCVGPVYAYNSTQLFAEVHCYNAGSGNGMWGSSYISFALVTQQAITLEASFPVSGW